MMKKIFLILILVLCSGAVVFSQNKVKFGLGYGIYLLNSENSNKVIGDKRFRSYLHYDFSYERENVFGYHLMLDYSYNQLTKDDAIVFVRTSEVSPDPIGYIGEDVTLINHNFDLDYVEDLNQYFSCGFGPSFVITNRIVEIPLSISAAPRMSLYDKLASSGLGANGFVQFSIPFDASKDYFYFTSKIKLRYTHSIWFDKGIRNLDDYNQDFITSEISVGVGYSF